MSSLTISQSENKIPKPIVAKLRSVVRRARAVMFVRGVLIVCAVALAALLLGMAIDSAVLIFSSAIRLAISLSLLACVLGAVWLFLVRPLSRSFDLTGIARIIEQRHPELEERISSAVQLLSSNDASEIRGSEALIGELAKQAVGQVSSVSPNKEFSYAAARPALIAAAIAAVILGSLFIIWPSTAGRLFNRVVAPLANIGNVQSEDILVEPGDVVVAANESLRIDVMVTDQRVRSTQMRTRNGDRVEAKIRMKRVESESENPQFTLSMPTVSSSFEYRIRAGGALTRYYQVKVVERPAVEQFELTYQFPEYMSRENIVVSNRSPNIRAPIGTIVTVVAKTKTPISSAQLKIDGLTAIDGAIVSSDVENEEASEPGECRWQVELTDEYIIGRSWQVMLEDEHGFTNDPQSQTIIAIPDKPPTIAIVEPSEMMQRRSTSDTLPLQYRVRDDFGVATVEMLFAIDGGQEQSRSLKIPPRNDAGLLSNDSSFNSLTQLELAKIAKSDSKQVRIHLRVKDMVPDNAGGPQSAVSETLTIIFDENADSYFEETAAADYAGIRDALQRVLANLQQADDRTSVLPNDVKPAGKLSEKVEKRIDEVRELTNDAKVELMQLADILPTTSFAPLEFEVGDLVASDVSSAREQAGLIKLAGTPLERGLYADASDRHTEKSIERTEKLIEDLDKLWAQIQEIADLRELAARQERVADEIAETTEQQLPNVDEMSVAKEQDELAKEVADLLKAVPDAHRDLLQEKEEQANELHEKADRVAARQERLAQLTAESNYKHADPERMQERLMDHVENQQKEIAEAVAKLDQEIEEAKRAGEDEKSDLREEPRNAIEEIKKDDYSAAAEEAKAAAENLQQAADALKDHHDVPDEKSTDQQKADNSGEKPESADVAKEKGDQAKQEQNDAKQDGAKQDGAKQDGAKQDGAKQDGAKQDGAKQDGAKQDGAKQDGAKQDGTKQDGTKQDGEANSANEGEQPSGDSGDPPNQPKESGTPKPQDEKLAEKAAELAAQQESVAEQIEALQEGDLDKAMKLMQEQVARETDEVAREADEITDLLNLLDQPKWARQHSERAKRELTKAQQQIDQSLTQLDRAIDDGEKQLAQAKAEEAKAAAEAAKEQAKNQAENSGEPANGEQASGEQANGEQPSGEQPSEPFTARESSAKKQATQTQRRSAQALRQAAAIMRQVAEITRNEANNIKPESIAQMMTADAIGEEIAEATDAAAEATSAIEATADAEQSDAAAMQASTEQTARRAAQALAKAADKAAQKAGLMSQASQSAQSAQSNPNGEQGEDSQASQQGEQSGEEGQDGQSGKSDQASKSKEPGDGEKGRLDGTLDNNLQQKLDDIGISASQWTRLPGSLKSRIRQSKSEGVPEEYRGMVRRYFREIARRSNESESNAGENK